MDHKHLICVANNEKFLQTTAISEYFHRLATAHNSFLCYPNFTRSSSLPIFYLSIIMLKNTNIPNGSNKIEETSKCIYRETELK